jgi:hypothetical protein
MNMFPTFEQHGAQLKLQRLVNQVERSQLHGGTEAISAREWLIKWLATPQEALDGRKPALFLDHEDFDLILVGLLIRGQTRQAWRNDAHDEAACEAC